MALKHVLAVIGLICIAVFGIAFPIFQQVWQAALFIFGIGCLSGLWLMKNPRRHV